MLRSMTGFGRCLVENNILTQQWEIRSVNHRYLDLRWHLPNSVNSLEALFEKQVRKKAARGRVEISLYLQFKDDYKMPVNFNQAQALAMLDSLQDLAESRHETFVPDYNRFLSIPALWRDNNSDLADEIRQELADGLNIALDDWNEGRCREGKALVYDLNERLALMSDWVRLIIERAPIIKEERIQALRERLTEGLEKVEAELDESRFLQEIVILADHLDVTEELTRLNTHLDRLQELLSLNESVGRKLDFTLQECFREITTCGNKISDADVARVIVDFKNELEKCREQVQNIE